MARTAKQVASQLKAAKASAAKRKKAANLMSTRQVKYGDEHTARKGNSVRAVSNQLTVKNQKILSGSTYRYGPGTKSNTTSRSNPGSRVGGKKTWVSQSPKQQAEKRATQAKRRTKQQAQWQRIIAKNAAKAK